MRDQTEVRKNSEAYRQQREELEAIPPKGVFVGISRGRVVVHSLDFHEVRQFLKANQCDNAIIERIGDEEIDFNGYMG